MQSILFIDDEEGVRRSLSRALKREPYQVHTASNGREGIEFVKGNTNRVAAVVSDYKMPGLDGLQTLSAISAIDPEITRIILTGYATMEAAISATNAGIDGFLTKPFDNIELRAKIKEIWVRKHLRQFVSEQIYAEINKSPASLLPRFHEVTILFADIRDFTRLSQQLSPEELVGFLNNYFFSPLGDIAYHYEGTLDKNIGDSMMVVFGSPVDQPDDTLRAVRAAVAMQQKAIEINTRLLSKGKPGIHIGIGIARGKVFSGIMGSKRKKEFTSVGMPVNIASRLQGLARGGEIFICQNVQQEIASEIETEALAPVAVKGLDDPIPVYRIRVGASADG